MEKVDRLGWAVGLTLAPYGLKVGIRTNEPVGLERLREVAAGLSMDPIDQEEVHLLYSLKIAKPQSKGRRHYNLLYLNASQLARSLDLNEVLTTLTESLDQMLKIQAKDRLFVNGSVVSIQQRLIVLPKTGESDQDDLLLSLQALGASIVSPTNFAIGPDGSLLGTNQNQPSPALVCFVDDTQQSPTASVRELSPGESSLYLLSASVNSRTDPALGLKSAAGLAQQVPSVSISESSSQVIADLILGRLS